MNDTSKDSPAAEPGLVDLTSDIVSAYVCNNPVPSDELSDLIETVHSALRSAIRQSEPPAAGDLIPAVPIEKSVKDDYIVCLEDRRRFKSLKRHLRTHHNLTPEEYRAKWNLSWDYPMVAPNYGTTRSRLAKKMGFGKKTGSPK